MGRNPIVIIWYGRRCPTMPDAALRQGESFEAIQHLKDMASRGKSGMTVVKRLSSVLAVAQNISSSGLKAGLVSEESEEGY